MLVNLVRAFVALAIACRAAVNALVDVGGGKKTGRANQPKKEYKFFHANIIAFLGVKVSARP